MQAEKKLTGACLCSHLVGIPVRCSQAHRSVIHRALRVNASWQIRHKKNIAALSERRHQTAWKHTFLSPAAAAGVCSQRGVASVSVQTRLPGRLCETHGAVCGESSNLRACDRSDDAPIALLHAPPSHGRQRGGDKKKEEDENTWRCPDTVS